MSSKAQKASVKVEVVGISVSKPVTNLPPEASLISPGTHVMLMVSDPQLSIVGVDAEKSKITSFTDNKGTDLSEGDAQPMEFIAAPDGKSGIVHLHQAKVPTAKSVRVVIKGQLHLMRGGLDKDAQTVAVPLNLELTLGL